jgi:hypothetical protein
VEILVGTDVHVLTAGADGRGVTVPPYVPNLQASAPETATPARAQR